MDTKHENPLFDLDGSDVADASITKSSGRPTTVAKRAKRKAVPEIGYDPVAEQKPAEQLPEKPVSLDNLTRNPVLFNEKMPANVTASLSIEISRNEEVAAEIVRQKGRYIDSVDNAKPGVPFTGRSSNASPSTEGFATPQQFTPSPNFQFRADGIELTGNIFDTGAGAQEPIPADNFAPDDPRSTEFVACANGNCAYREGCLRYRMKNKSLNTFVFFPDACRMDGVYIGIDDTDFTAYSPMNSLESTSTPVL